MDNKETYRVERTEIRRQRGRSAADVAAGKDASCSEFVTDVRWDVVRSSDDRVMQRHWTKAAAKMEAARANGTLAGATKARVKKS